MTTNSGSTHRRSPLYGISHLLSRCLPAHPGERGFPLRADPSEWIMRRAGSAWGGVEVRQICPGVRSCCNVLGIGANIGDATGLFRQGLNARFDGATVPSVASGTG